MQEKGTYLDSSNLLTKGAMEIPSHFKERLAQKWDVQEAGHMGGCGAWMSVVGSAVCWDQVTIINLNSSRKLPGFFSSFLTRTSQTKRVIIILGVLGGI